MYNQNKNKFPGVDDICTVVFRILSMLYIYLIETFFKRTLLNVITRDGKCVNVNPLIERGNNIHDIIIVHSVNHQYAAIMKTVNKDSTNKH